MMEVGKLPLDVTHTSEHNDIWIESNSIMSEEV